MIFSHIPLIPLSTLSVQYIANYGVVPSTGSKTRAVMGTLEGKTTVICGFDCPAYALFWQEFGLKAFVRATVLLPPIFQLL